MPHTCHLQGYSRKVGRVYRSGVASRAGKPVCGGIAMCGIVFYVICCIWIAVDSILKKCSMIVMYLYIILLIFANVFENITF